MPCGGEGICGKCRVLVRQGACPPSEVETQLFSPEELAQGLRLACQISVSEPMTIEVPQTSLLGSVHKILAHGTDTWQFPADPPVCKRHVELPSPDRGCDEADLSRLQRAHGPLQADLEVLRQLPARLRATVFRGTIVAAEDYLLDFEPGNTEAESFAVAIDVGTTTLAAVLVDHTSGAQRAVAARLNPQTAFGDDVLSRILHARESSQGLRDLHEAVTATLDDMIGELAAQAGIARNRIYEATFAGNTTMQQLLLGIDPGPLGEVPFVPATADPVLVPAAQLGLHLHPRAYAYVLPVIGGFVGGDTVAGILACGLIDSPGPTLLVDIGTNGEIVLWANGQLTAASTAAGPAFEGARISQGMRAANGAVEKVVVDGRLRLNVIGDVPPLGLCGSALIDLAAELLRHRLLTSAGRLSSPAQLPSDLLPDLRRRVVMQSGQPAFTLVPAGESAGGSPIVVTQRDFRELQLATGAIRAGTQLLLQRAGLCPADLQAVLLAGGFGNFIRRSNAQRIGLLPRAIDRRRIRYQGNTSLAGARLTAISRTARRLAADLARRTEHVDLSTDPSFQSALGEAMIFPSADRAGEIAS
jgi:uncharacterized 2Fe-2S/4Fe-4S cluster protein (DUF4445 family)